MSDRIIPSPEIYHRDQFGRLLNARRLVTGRAIEVGCHRAAFAAQFLNTWHGPLLVSVDPYCEYPEMPHARTDDSRFAQTRMAVHRRADAWRLVKLLSEHAPDHNDIAGHPIDFIYIDGAHDYDNVTLDLATWWPLLSPHGILAGHDYDAGHPGIIQAVCEFALAHDLTIYTTTTDSNPSWYAYRTPPPKLLHYKHFIPGIHLPAPPAEPAILLSLLVPTLPARADRLDRLTTHLAEQIVAAHLIGHIEILTDNSDAPLGDKRNALLARAKGAYIASFDDDDLPGPFYIQAITEAIQAHPGIHCITFDGVRYEDDRPQSRLIYRLDHGNGLAPHRTHNARVISILDGNSHPVNQTRRIGCNHICPIRADLAKASRFWGSLAYADDQPFWKALHLFDLIQTEHHIPYPLYHYLWSATDTATQQLPHHQRTSQLIGTQGRMTFHRLAHTFGLLPQGTIVWHRWNETGDRIRVEAPNGSGHTVPLTALSPPRTFAIRLTPEVRTP